MKNKRIIIVEDQPIVALDFQTYLNANNYKNVTYFISGKEALNNIKKIRPDLVLLDIKLKDNVSGLDIAEYLNEVNIPFIFVSAFSNPENYRKALNLTPAKILHKPIEHKSLLEAIDEILHLNSAG